MSDTAICQPRLHFPTFVPALGVLCALGASISSAAATSHKIPGHQIPSSVTQGAQPYHPLNPVLALAVRLPMRDEADLDALLARLYDPADPAYGKYLAPGEFADRYGASPRDLEKVINYFRGLGCTDITSHPNRLLLDAQCPQPAVESAFGIKVSHWLTPQNEEIRTIDQDPSIPEGLPIEAIHGLTSIPRHPQLIRRGDNDASSPAAGSGPGGGLTPSDIKSAYGLSGASQNGAGQTLALFELDGYLASDIASYASSYGLAPGVPLQNVLIDGFSGSAGSGAPEVTLDIELMMALAPKAAKILVYEGPNTDVGVIDTYQRIANDDLAPQVSTSWGAPESQSPSAVLNTENQIFKQMASQGQSIYAASGDSGANADGQNLGVDDPGSQPYITGTGGTTLATNADHSYQKETTWWSASRGWGGGGGISTVWPIPSWQSGSINSASLGSSTHRNVPDVSLDSDPATGYSVYVGGKWSVYGGTSCAAPLWAAFTSLVNQQRATAGKTPLGFANPALYSLGGSPAYASSFHDIADGSTNGHYPAVSAYDLSTGWGTIEGANLIAELSGVASPSPTPTPSPSPTPPSVGCFRASKEPMSSAEAMGASLNLGLPFAAAFLVRRKNKR